MYVFLYVCMCFVNQSVYNWYSITYRCHIYVENWCPVEHPCLLFGFLTTVYTDFKFKRNCSNNIASPNWPNPINLSSAPTNNRFYVMLSGKTSVYIDTFRSDEDVTPETKPADEQRKEVTTASDPESQNDVIAREQFGKFIMHFGEYVPRNTQKQSLPIPSV